MASYRVQRVASLQPSEESEALLPLLPAEQQQALSQPAASNPNFAENIQESWSVSDSIVSIALAPDVITLQAHVEWGYAINLKGPHVCILCVQKNYGSSELEV